MPMLIIILALVVALPASAQESRPDLDSGIPQPVTTQPIDPVVAGQRQSSDQVAQEAGIKPMTRVGGRIENRVRSRINNRLDRNYRPSANVTLPPATGEDPASRATQRTNR